MMYLDNVRYWELVREYANEIVDEGWEPDDFRYALKSHGEEQIFIDLEEMGRKYEFIADVVEVAHDIYRREERTTLVLRG